MRLILHHYIAPLVCHQSFVMAMAECALETLEARDVKRLECKGCVGRQGDEIKSNFITNLSTFTVTCKF